MVASREPAPPRHVVQFYENERQLSERVAPFLADALERGEAVLVVSRLAVRESLAARLPAGEPGQRVFVDGPELLESLLDADGLPDPDRFRQQVARHVEELLGRFGGLRVYAEMVDLLAEQGRYEASARLEGFWN